MPIHDWTKVNSGTFHAFHVAWVAEIQRSLNAGVLPEGYYALAEQVAGNFIPDVLTLREPAATESVEFGSGGGTAIAIAPPQTAITDTIADAQVITAPQRRIAIRHTTDDRIVALLEIVSPGNKDKRGAVEQFIDKAAIALGEGLHLQIVDLFPPGTFDPDGLHGLFWPRLGGQAYHPPAGKPLTLAAYNAAGADGLTCYVEPTCVGVPLVDMPLFLTGQRYVKVPLELSYRAAYAGMPMRWRQVIEAAD
jgi:hypothetical protein